MGLSLCIDTSGAVTYTLLGSDSGVILARCASDSVESHIEELAKNVEKLFTASETKPTSLTAIVLGLGPGSFTGLRIGAAFASGFSSALHIPVYGASSFAARAYAISLKSDIELCAVTADARREEVFYGLYNVRSMATVIEPSIWERGAYEHHFQSLSGVKGIADDGVETAEGLYRLYTAHRGLFTEWTHESIGDVELQYVRPVSARTIKERSMARKEG